MTDHTNSLEERARDLAKDLGRRKETTPVVSLLEQEIALTLDHIDGFRDLHKRLLRSMLRSECYVESDLLKIETYDPILFLFRFEARNDLKNKLLKLEIERRKLSLTYESELRTLWDRLLTLVNRRAQLTP